MCTAITFRTNDSYFGRTLDVCSSYGEEITVTPRNFQFDFRQVKEINHHYAIIGTAVVKNNFPLYFDAANEYGLAMAGLDFKGNAVYYPEAKGKDNITPFEFVPWILSQCKNLDDARILLERINLQNESFSADMPLSPLHWIIADREKSITVESVNEGIKIYENPAGVLTNNPEFDFHLKNLAEYSNLTNVTPENKFGTIHTRGLGAKGLPGDNSSSSRFVRVAFTKFYAEKAETEVDSVSQFFHILNSVNQVKGCNKASESESVFTSYTSCINLCKGIYYYTTYSGGCVSSVDMNKCNLEGNFLIKYPSEKSFIINRQN